MRTFDYLIRLLAVMTIVVSAVAIAPGDQWLLELASHFRAQYLAAQALLLVGLAFRARWAWCLALLPVLVLNFVPLAPYWPRPSADPLLTGDSLTLMSANLAGDDTGRSAFLDMLERAPPDIALLVEFGPGWSEAARSLHEIYPHRVEIPRSDAFGIAIFSRLPFLEQRSFRLQTTSAIDVRINLSGRPVRILGVHLRPPTNAVGSTERNRQLSDLATIASRETEPLLVMGDLNITPYSPVFTDTLGATGLLDTGRARGWYFSWPTFLPILGIPIDLCMVSEHFVVLDHQRGPYFGSDHYPLMATVALR